MFGIKFKGHPDLRRILLYEEFVGHPLRKDYPIDKAQPLVPYREVSEIDKLAPFGIEEGQPFARIDWESRLAGRDEQVSPAIGVAARPAANTERFGGGRADSGAHRSTDGGGSRSARPEEGSEA